MNILETILLMLMKAYLSSTAKAVASDQSALSPALCPSSVPLPYSPSTQDSCVVQHSPCRANLKQWYSPLWASVTHLRMDLYLQHRTRKQLVNPFSLRPLICSYLLQQPKKARVFFPLSFLLIRCLENLPCCLNTIDPSLSTTGSRTSV